MITVNELVKTDCHLNLGSSEIEAIYAIRKLAKKNKWSIVNFIQKNRNDYVYTIRFFKKENGTTQLCDAEIQCISVNAVVIGFTVIQSDT